MIDPGQQLAHARHVAPDKRRNIHWSPDNGIGQISYAPAKCLGLLLERLQRTARGSLALLGAAFGAKYRTLPRHCSTWNISCHARHHLVGGVGKRRLDLKSGRGDGIDHTTHGQLNWTTSFRLQCSKRTCHLQTQIRYHRLGRFGRSHLLQHGARPYQRLARLGGVLLVIVIIAQRGQCQRRLIVRAILAGRGQQLLGSGRRGGGSSGNGFWRGRFARSSSLLPLRLQVGVHAGRGCCRCRCNRSRCRSGTRQLHRRQIVRRFADLGLLAGNELTHRLFCKFGIVPQLFVRALLGQIATQQLRHRHIRVLFRH